MAKNLDRGNQTSQSRPANRAQAEKKTPPLIAAAIPTVANTEFFNSLG